jgi:hypothetical protein
MKKLKKSLSLMLILSSLIIIASSGKFTYFEAERDLKVAVVPHDLEYINFQCQDGYSAIVSVEGNGSVEFDALIVGNYLNEMEEIFVHLSPVYLGIPPEMSMFIETEDGDEVVIPPGEDYTFKGYLYLDNAPAGEYVVPVYLFARWENGDAGITLCPVKIIVQNLPEIRKELISGSKKVCTHKYYEWVFRIYIENPGSEKNFVVKDTIPGEFEVNENETYASEGYYEFTSHGKSTHLTWKVQLGSGEGAYMDIKVYTRLNPAGKQEFTSCGEYYLNEGAYIEGYDVVSDPIIIEASCK